MKSYIIDFNLNDLRYTSVNSPGKSASEIVSGGTFHEETEKNGAKVNICLCVPVPYCDISTLVSDVQSVYTEAFRKTGMKLGKVLLSFQNQKNAIDVENPYYWPEKLFDKLDELEKFVVKNGGELRFSEFRKFRSSSGDWTLKQVRVANLAVDYLSGVIMDNKLSPYEAVVFLASWAAENIVYDDEATKVKKDRNLELSNSIVGLISNKRSLCVGLTELCNAVLGGVGYGYDSSGKRTDSEALATSKITSAINIVASGGRPDHCQSLIYIRDPKYGIDGSYVLDLTGALDKYSYRQSEPSPKNWGKRVNNDRFLYAKKDILEVVPEWRFFNFHDGAEDVEDVPSGDFNPLEFLKSLKNRTDEFLSNLGESTKSETFDSVIGKMSALAKQHSLSSILEKISQSEKHFE